MSLTGRSQENIEREFLILCGFDMSNGFWQQDVDFYKNRYPWLYENLFKLRGKN